MVVQPQQLTGTGAPVSSSAEHAAFQFFTHAGVSTIAGCTDISFWTRLVPQCAQSDAAVYHASVAVGALLMRAMDSQGSPNGQRTHQLTLLAVERQSRAIQSTMSALAVQGTTAPQPVASAMVLLLLFCIEALQGREEEALQLIQRGINALSATGSTAGTAGLDAQLDRLRMQCGMFNVSGTRAALRGKMRAMERVKAPASGLTTLNDARDELSDLLSAVQYTVSDRWERLGETQIDQHQTLESALNNWRMRFEQLVSTLPGWPAAVPRHDDDLVCQLRLRERIAHVWLADSPDNNELVYDSDKYAHIFANIVDEASRCLGSSHEDRAGGDVRTLTHFTFEMGFIPPLYWAFLKCRRPVVRRKLLSLLRQAPLQEGLWNRRIMVQVAEQVMAYEEAERSESAVPISRSEDEHAFASRGESVTSSERGESTVEGQSQSHSQQGQQVQQELQGQEKQQPAHLYHAGVHSPSHQHLHSPFTSGLPPEFARIKVVHIGLRTTLADGSPGDYVQCFGRSRDAEGGLQVVLEFVATAS
ncbi:hypothetical protein SBRCBS47491_006238 [Sporothrix bragantina]|uniref:C6 zinc finger domain containing protein n=1 Tax=Sporothrix bragantina TaxID=671064 RepID=A0ABP0C4E2_9PEZI